MPAPWTEPRTWSFEEVVTAAQLNEQLRDNLKYLDAATGIAAVFDGTSTASEVQSAINDLNGERGTILIIGQPTYDASIDVVRANIVGLGHPGGSGGGGTVVTFTGSNGFYSSQEDNKSFTISKMRILGSGVKATNGQILIDFTGQNTPQLRDVDVAQSDIGILLKDGTSVECNYGTYMATSASQCRKGWQVANGRSHLWFGGRDWNNDVGASLESGNNLVFVGKFSEANDTYGFDSVAATVGFLGCRMENTDATNLHVGTGAGRHYYDGATLFSSGVDVVDDNTPKVTFGVGQAAQASADDEANLLDDLHLNDDLYVGEGTVAADRNVHVAAPAGQHRYIRVYSGPSDDAANLRWLWRLANNTSESGSDAGSDFELVARTDAGGSLGTWIVVTRSNGKVQLAGSELEVDGDLNHDGSQAGFFGKALTTQPELTYSRGSETTAEAQLRAALDSLGLVADNTTA